MGFGQHSKDILAFKKYVSKKNCGYTSKQIGIMFVIVLCIINVNNILLF